MAVRWVRRHPLVTAAAAAAVILIVIAGVVIAVMPPPGGPEPEATPFRPPRGEFEPDADQHQLAFRFRPHLFFDGKEPWRPVALDALISDRYPTLDGHGLCQRLGGGGRCRSLLGLESLASTFLSINLAGHELNGRDASAPPGVLEACGALAPRDPPLQDCDAGPRAAIYYHQHPAQLEVDEEVPYRYLDYWWFLRYNDAGNGSVFDHEGDWEGMALVLRAEVNRPVQWVEIAAHELIASYLPGVISWSAGHPRLFLARGTHAAYVRRCLRVCRQPQKVFGVALPELSSDGKAEWRRDRDEACRAEPPCIRPLETVGEPDRWVAWPGRWGSTLHPRVNRLRVGEAITRGTRIRLLPDGSVASSVGKVAELYAKANGPDRSPCSPLYQSRYLPSWPAAIVGRLPEAGDCEKPTAAVAECKRWTGPYVVATVCEEDSLRRAIKEGRIPEPGDVRVEITRQSGRQKIVVATAPGIAQAVGPLLEPGDKVTVSGRAPRGTELLVRARSGPLLEKATVFDERRFTDLGMFGEHSVPVTITIRKGTFGPLFERRPDVGGAMGGPAAPRADPSAIRALGARRRGRVVRISFRSTTRQVLVVFTRRRRGDVLAFVRRRTGRRPQKALALQSPVGTRRVAVAPIGRAGVVGQFEERSLPAPIRRR
jgi:hypothetical protein